MLKKIIITLLIISPVALFTFELTYPRPKIAPQQALVGAWETEAEIRVTEAEGGVTSYWGDLQVNFSLYEDGTVEGTVGDAAMQNAYFKRNRGWFGKLLGMGTDYIIVGGLSGSITSEIQCARFYIVGDFDEKGIRGDIDCKECWKGDRKQRSFGDGPLIYTRVEQP